MSITISLHPSNNTAEPALISAQLSNESAYCMCTAFGMTREVHYTGDATSTRIPSFTTIHDSTRQFVDLDWFLHRADTRDTSYSDVLEEFIELASAYENQEYLLYI